MRKIKRTKHGDYELRVKFPVFRGYTIHIIIGDDIMRSIQARYPEHLESEEDQNTSAMTINAMENDTHIFLTESDIFKPYEIANILAHETWHAVRAMLLHIGSSVTGTDKTTNEVVAYHLGFTIERATRFIDEVIHDVRSRATKAAKRRNR